MISYIRGELVAVEDEKAIIDVMGVGYGVFMPAQAMQQLPPTGNEVKLHTYLNVKEDLMQLFGFLSRDDLNVFKLVIGVSGIGPKGGLNILSQLSPDELRFAVVASDVKAISATPGIGKKTAEKLIIELKDKLHIEDVVNRETGEVMEVSSSSSSNEKQAEVAQALVSLGYDNTESLRAVRKVEDPDDDLSVEDLLKQALKQMMI